MDMQDIQLKLMDYGNLENTEIGNVAFSLASLWDERIYLSEEFVEVLEKEMRLHLANFLENTEIVEKEKVEKYKYKVLIWI